jgi:hypothetical protein
MAIGDLTDIKARLAQYLPPWFGDEHPTLDAILAGFATNGVTVYSGIQFAILQTRLQTATGIYLELIAQDYLGNFPRHHGENDASYRKRIQVNLIRERATRQAIIDVLTDLTGRTPIVYEGWRPTDTNWLDGGFILDGASTLASITPYEAFVIAFRPFNNGTANNGLDNASFSLDNSFYLGVTDIVITDADIYNAVQQTKCGGTIVWVYISD